MSDAAAPARVRRRAGRGRRARRRRLPRLAVDAAGAGAADRARAARPGAARRARRGLLRARHGPHVAAGRSSLLATSGTAVAELRAGRGRGRSCRGCRSIVLTADRPPELRDRGAPQTIDQVRLYGRAAKWYAELPLLDGDPATDGARPLGRGPGRRDGRGRAGGRRCTSTSRSASRCCPTGRCSPRTAGCPRRPFDAVHVGRRGSDRRWTRRLVDGPCGAARPDAARA